MKLKLKKTIARWEVEIQDHDTKTIKQAIKSTLKHRREWKRIVDAGGIEHKEYIDIETARLRTYISELRRRAKQ